MCPKQLDTELSAAEIGTGLNPPSPESVVNAQGDHHAAGSPDRQAMMAKMSETDPTAIQDAISDAYDPSKNGLAEQLDQVTEFPTEAIAKEMLKIPPLISDKPFFPSKADPNALEIQPFEVYGSLPTKKQDIPIINDAVWNLLKENLKNTVMETVNQQLDKQASLLDAQQRVLSAVETEKDSYKHDCERYRSALAGIGDHRPAKLEMILIGLGVHYFFTRNRRDAGKLVLVAKWLRVNGWSQDASNRFVIPQQTGAMDMEQAISHTLLKSLNMDVVAKHLLEHTVKGG